jgi:hypothetical protein
MWSTSLEQRDQKLRVIFVFHDILVAIFGRHRLQPVKFPKPAHRSNGVSSISLRHNKPPALECYLALEFFQIAAAFDIFARYTQRKIQALTLLPRLGKQITLLQLGPMRKPAFGVSLHSRMLPIKALRNAAGLRLASR